MGRFKKDDVVYLGEKRLVVKERIDNPLLQVYQYAFYDTNLICGEQSLKANPDDPELRISDCYKEQYDDEPEEEDLEDDKSTFQDDVDFKLNTYANSFGTSIYSTDTDIMGVGGNLFFKPDFMFVKWLVNYANGRMIIDVGAGQGHLVRMIKKMGGKAIGLEPNMDYMQVTKMRMMRDQSHDINEILPFRIQDQARMIQGLGDKAMLVFARPCHSGFVEDGLDIMPKGMEALYITLEENLERYDDLGDYEDSAVLLEHKGISEDNEVVYSIKK